MTSNPIIGDRTDAAEERMFQTLPNPSKPHFRLENAVRPCTLELCAW